MSYQDYQSIETIARDVLVDLVEHEISGSDRALDRLEELLNRILYTEYVSENGKK